MNVASAMVAGAELTLRRPISSLRSYLGCFWAIETTSATRLQTLPDGCAAISVEVREGASPKCLFVGPCLTATERVPAARQIPFGVRLRPGVAFARFQTLLQRMEASPPNPARAAGELGYFDHAHLAMRLAVRMSPGLVAAHRVADFSKTC